MALNYDSTGGLFTRVGRILHELSRTTAAFGSDLDTGLESISDQYVDSLQLAIDGLYTDAEAYRLVHSTYLQALAGYAANTVIAQVHAESPLSSQTIVPALKKLVALMKADTESVDRPTVTATVTAGSTNLGDTSLIASVKDEYGVQRDDLFAETLTVEVTADAGNGGTLNSETLTVTGAPAVETTSHLWPGGSGASTTMTVTDPSVDNLLINADFEDWSGTGNNTPGTWAILTGAAGTTVLREATTFLRDSYAARLVSDGSTLVTLRQAVTLSPNTPYGFTIWVRASASDSSGVFRIRLTGPTGTVISDDASTALSATADMNATISTSAFTKVSAIWNTPRQLPTTVYLEFGYSVAPSSPKYLLVDGLAFGRATRAYTQGPALFAAAKSLPSAQGDSWSVAVANSAGADTFVRGFDRLFSMRANNLALVSAASQTIDDTLITA